MTDPRVELFDAGYTDLVSVAPPGSSLSKRSKLKAGDLGKCPAKKGSNGWYGYDWIHSEPTRAEVESWVRWGANVGLRGTNFPALDIDCLDAKMTQRIRRLAFKAFGPAPVRVGSPPKELLVYRTKEPFKRMAVKIGDHLVEWLCDQRQYLVYGTHPKGFEYKWLKTPLWELDPEKHLAPVTLLQVRHFLNVLATEYGGEIVGTGSNAAVEVEQDTLEAPNMHALDDLVKAIPNSFAERDDYIAVGHAIKAAGAEDEEGAYLLFSEWAARWDGGTNDPEIVRADWRRMHPPFRVGWSYLVSLAPESFNELVHVFEADPDYEPPQLERDPNATIPVDFTDDWCAEQIMPLLADKLRYDYPNDRWHAWDGTRWAHATMGEQERLVLDGLRKLARSYRPTLMRLEGKARQKAAQTIAKLGNAGMLSNVTRMLQSHPQIVVGIDAFDMLLWEINTPGGTVDLKTGELLEHDPKAMHSKSTAVTPLPGAAPIWTRFLNEATRGDKDLARFMQKTVGYSLTGVCEEQTLSFVWGGGLNGKSVFLDTVSDIIEEYAATAPMDTFSSSKGDRHPTDLAGLMGARLVTASETQAGRSWDEQRVKALTGGDKIRARFMRQDFVEFQPRFKLIIVGNHEPQIDNVDEAMRRRIHIIPFTFKPPIRDGKLKEKLKAEWPQILQWMIEGCTMWQNEGLEPPECVLTRTRQYFLEEDQPRNWLEANCTLEPEGNMSAADAYQSWSLWCSAQGEPCGTQRSLTKSLRPLEHELGIQHGKVGERDKRMNGWHGIRLNEDPHELKGSL